MAYYFALLARYSVLKNLLKTYNILQAAGVKRKTKTQKTMFVESMSFTQMRNQALDDLKPIVSKVIHHGKAISRVMRKTNMSHFKKYYDYTAPVTKNHWLYSIELKNAFAKSYSYTCFSYFETGKKSYAAILVAPNTREVFYFTKHFFDRYNERLALGGKSRREVMMAFLEDNNNFSWIPTGKKRKSGLPEVFVQMKYGVGLGAWHMDINFVELRTFITNEMLKNDQIILSYHLEEATPIKVVRDEDEIIPIPQPQSLKIKSNVLPPHIVMKNTMVFKHF